MCTVIQEVFEKDFEKAIQQEREAAKKEREETVKQEREHTALELLELGILPDEKIAEISHLTLEEVKALNARRTA